MTTGPSNAQNMRDLEKGSKLKRERTTLRTVPLGYSYVAAYADGHEAAPLFRRFGALKARVLLTQQAELAKKEEELASIDAEEHEDAEDFHHTDNMTWLRDRNQERKQLIQEISGKLRRYEKDLLLYQQMRHLPKAKKWQKKNFTRLLDNHQPICQGERVFLEEDDLISIRKEAEDSAEMLESIDELRRKIFRGFGKGIFKERQSSIFQDSKEITLYSEKWMKVVGRAFFGLLVSAIVTSGVVALYLVNVDEWRVTILCLSTLVCAILTSVFTTAKKSEVFGVAAAYCAVLVVFVGTTLDKRSDVALQLGNSWINGTISG
ncbi:hypothetical protein TWF281_007014 [Arthrobotrys megalospora]